MEFGDPGDALRALQMPRLTLAGKKIVIKPRILHSAKVCQTESQAGADSASQQQEEKKTGVREMIETDILKIPKVWCVCLSFLLQ